METNHDEPHFGTPGDEVRALEGSQASLPRAFSLALSDHCAAAAVAEVAGFGKMP